MDASVLIKEIGLAVAGLIGFYVGWTLTRPKPEEVKKQKEEGKDGHSGEAGKTEEEHHRAER